MLIEQLERLAGFGFGKVGFAFYLIGGVGFSNVIRKPTSNCSTEPDYIYIYVIIHLSSWICYWIITGHMDIRVMYFFIYR